MTHPRLSVVIPAYNEAASLPDLVGRCRDAFAARRDEVEVILVDNGSTDGTPEVLAALIDGSGPLRTLRVPVNRGYGYGILAGLCAARGEIVGWTHADLQTDPADVLKAFDMAEAAGGAAGCFVKGDRRSRPLLDRLFSRAMAFYESVLFGHPFREINAQPTLFPRSFMESWRDPPHDFSLDLHAYVEARRAGLRVIHVPVFFPPRRHGQSHWNRGWRDRWKFIRRTLSFSHALKARYAGEGRRDPVGAP